MSAGAFTSAANDQSFANDKPPDGTYDAVEFVKAERFYKQADGTAMMRFYWRIASGPLTNFDWTSVQTLEQDSPGFPITARMTVSLGVDSAQVDAAGAGWADELLRQLYGLRGRLHKIEVKTNGSYVNTTPKGPAGDVQQSVPGTGYGSPPPGPRPSNAIYGSDSPDAQPPAGQGVLNPEQRNDLQRDDPPTSDVPEPRPGEFEHPPQKGEIDPETGEPIPF